MTDATNGAERPAPSIVYLDVDDEITSAAMRLRTMTAERVVLVLPYGSRLATSRINFRLLAREALANGKRLEIVAPDASARALAGSAGLAVHASVNALETQDASPGLATNGSSPGGASEAVAGAAAVAVPSDGTATQVIAVPRTPEPVPLAGRRRRGGVDGRRAGVVAIVVLALLAGGAYAAFTLLPSATIVLTPTAETLGPIQLDVQARPDVTTPDLATLTVPAQTFRFDLQASGTFQATGKDVSETSASGSVTFENCDTGGNLTVPTGSRVSTDANVGFITQAKVTVKRASVFPFSCKTGSVAVRAEHPGTAANVAAGAIDRIPPGYDSIVVSVTNPQPTTGGTHTETPIVLQQDVDAASAQLSQQLQADFEQEIGQATGVPAGTTLFESTKSLGAATPSVDPSTLVGKNVPQFDLGSTATGTILGADPTPVRALAEQQLATQVGAGWQLVPGSTQIDVGQATAGGSAISFPVSVTASRARIVDHDTLVAEIRGLVLAQARSRLEAVGSVDIALWPDWVSTIPTDTSRISLTIVQPQGPLASGQPSGAIPSGSGPTPGSPGPAPTASP